MLYAWKLFSIFVVLALLFLLAPAVVLLGPLEDVALPGGSAAVLAGEGDVDYIIISPDNASIDGGGAGTQAYSAEAFDAQGISLGDVTQNTSFTIEPEAGGSWEGCTYTSEHVGDWVVTGTHITGKADTAILWVLEPPEYPVGGPLSWSLLPTDDSWVNEANKNQTNDDGTLHVRWRASGQERRAYLKFNLSYLPAGTVIDSAILHVYRSTDNGVPSAYQTADNWTEGGITWNNMPALGAWVVSGTGNSSPAGQWLSWTINSYAASEYAGDKILSVVLKFASGPVNNAAHHADFTSKDATSNKPYLGIYYHGCLNYTLTMAVSGNGTTTPTGVNSYANGTVVNITATPDTYWNFVNWTGDVGTVGNVNSATTNITMTGNYSITANFAIKTYTITATGEPVVQFHLRVL